MKKITIQLLKGDITERTTEAIMNTSNDRLILGSGLGGAIKAKGGATIQEQCSKYGSIKIGDAVVTSGGELKAKYVIHSALTPYDGFIQHDNIQKSLLNTLRLAENKKIKTIAIPDMSIGIERFPPLNCAITMFRIIKKFMEEENKTIEKIEVVVWDVETLRIYRKAYREIFPGEEK